MFLFDMNKSVILLQFRAIIVTLGGWNGKCEIKFRVKRYFKINIKIKYLDHGQWIHHCNLHMTYIKIVKCAGVSV